MTSLLLLQLGLPLVLAGWFWFWRSESMIGASARVLAAIAVSVALIKAGVWLVLPWWAAWVLSAGLVAAAVRSFASARPMPFLPRGTRAWMRIAAIVAIAAYAGQTAIQAMSGRDAPDGAVELSFPLRGGAFMVVNGGSTLASNAHRRTADPRSPGYRAYKGQSHAVDFVELSPWGAASQRIAPRAPQDYAIYGAEVLAPCDGVVVAAENGIPDTPVGTPDRRHMAGNHVRLRCGDVEVLLAHLRTGSVTLAVGSRVEAGMFVGRVGNSGNTDLPHLHVHAQRPSTTADPLAGDPLPITFDGEYLVRGDWVRRL